MDFKSLLKDHCDVDKTELKIIDIFSQETDRVLWKIYCLHYILVDITYIYINLLFCINMYTYAHNGVSIVCYMSIYTYRLEARNACTMTIAYDINFKKSQEQFKTARGMWEGCC